MKREYVRKLPNPLCGTCHAPISLDDILPKIRRGERVVHDCGKVLNAGKTEQIEVTAYGEEQPSFIKKYREKTD